MVKNTLSYLADREGVEVIEVTVDLPTDEAQILYLVEDALRRENGTIKLVLIDHISSTPAIIFPVKELVALSRSYGAVTLVDGAHALGQVPVNLNELDPDFYTSNGHKWLCTSKSAAFLYVKKEYQDLIHPTVISNQQYGAKTSFQARFEYTGTRDYSPFLSFSSALRFRELSGGDEHVMTYNNDLCLKAANMMSEAWNTTRPVPDHMTASTINVRIPCNTRDPACYTWNEVGFYLWLFLKNIWALGFQDANGVWYLRLSCQIYNQMSDYEELKEAIDELNTLSLVLSPTFPMLSKVTTFFEGRDSHLSQQPERALFSPYPSMISSVSSVALRGLSQLLYFTKVGISVGSSIY
jgi:selenocysteine lyase/cysteine desulfurase